MSIDPCDPNPCGTGAVCEVAEGKALCSCPQGMTGDPLVKCGKYLILFRERCRSNDHKGLRISLILDEPIFLFQLKQLGASQIHVEKILNALYSMEQISLSANAKEDMSPIHLP